MKRFTLILLILISISSAIVAQEHPRYALIWNDEFDAATLDGTTWSKIWRSTATWAIHMSSNERLYDLDKGDLVLRGMVNDFLPKDTASVLTGGVWSKNRKKFGFGRIEIRAKFDEAAGYWPALWMLPQHNQAINWPHGGEIDIMEHFSTDQFVNQTVHSNYTYNLRKNYLPPHVAYPSYRAGDYNTYGVERFHDSLVFFVNGQRSFCYPRYSKGDDGQFPFSQHDYYLIMDAQLGYRDGPAIDKSSLPVELRIDYVRYYELDTRTDAIPEPREFQTSCKRLRKLRRVVYDKKTQFDNPDEYSLVVKCGKATVAGNRRWAESTLEQLVDEDGYIGNIEVHDWAACAVRGVSLEQCGERLTCDKLMRLLDKMAFYKLNYLKWSSDGAFTAEEADTIRKHASDLGITLMDYEQTLPNVNVIPLENTAQVPALNRVFLSAASPQGGWLLLNSLGKEGMDALMAFAERYWRGGDADVSKEVNFMPSALSTAGTRLANFKEKTAIHNQRFPMK